MKRKLIFSYWGQKISGRKTLKVMRLCFIFTFITVLDLSAVTKAQTIQLKSTAYTLKVLFNEVERQSGKVTLFSNNELDMNREAGVSAGAWTIEELYRKVLTGTDLRFQIEKDYIVIKKGGNAPQSTAVKIQPRTIRGKVVDENRQPLPGVTIMMKGTQKGCSTDVNGEYTLVVPDQKIDLIFSFVGMQNQVIAVDNQEVIDVVMAASSEGLNEVVVTGYQTILKERATGSFSTINAEKLETKLQPNLNSVLEGLATGLVVDKKGKIEIRGISTFNAERDPLIVVDGYPIEGDIESINPDNIENITVLKDGVAASIYGSRAANGVIVITTKRGKIGSLNVSYKGTMGVTLKPDLSALNRVSTEGYIDAELDFYHQSPIRPSMQSTSPMGRVTWLMMMAREHKISEAEAMNEIEALKKVDGLGQVEKYVFRNNLNHQHNVMISGGNDKNLFNATINYLGERENMIHAKNSRLILDLKNDWTINKYLSLGLLANVVYRKNDKPLQTYTDLLAWESNSLIQPYDNLIDPQTGKPTEVFSTSTYKTGVYEQTPGMKPWTYNPIENLSKEMVHSQDVQMRVGGKLKVNVIEGLNIEAGGNWTRGNRVDKTVRDQDAYSVRIAYNDATSKANNADHYFPDGAMIDEARNINESYTIRSQINFDRAFRGDMHRVMFIAGNEIRRTTYDNNTYATRLGYNSTAGSFIPVNIKDYNAGKYRSDMLFFPQFFSSSLKNGSYAYRDNRFVSWYANGSYEYDNRFILSGSIRLDLTNFFGTNPDYRYKPLWSVGGTYKLGNEKFLSSFEWLNRLNIRASYGINGNIALNEGPFMILSVGSYDKVTEGVPYAISSPANEQLRWEKTSTTNFGADVAIFKSRLNLTFDYYFRNSTDLLANDLNDPTTGFSSLMKNVGKMTNNGIEISIGGDIIRCRQFRWNAVYNFSCNTNKVKEYNVKRLYSTSMTGAPKLVKGKPADALYVYRYAGLNENGNALCYNVKDEKIKMSAADVEDVVYAGTTRPKYDMSFTNAFSWKGIDLSFMFIAKLGHKYLKDSFCGTNYINRHVTERWREKGDEATKIYPKLENYSSDRFYFPYSDFLVGKANYLKLRDLTLSYRLPENILNPLGVVNARLYFQARNLFTVTAKGVDIDPEVAEYNESGMTGSFTEQGFTSLPRRAEFYIGLSFMF